MEEKNLDDTRNNIQFFKEQIIFYQNLLLDAIKSQNDLSCKSATFLDKVKCLKEKTEFTKKKYAKQLYNLENTDQYLLSTIKKRKYADGKSILPNDKQIRTKQFNARRELQENENEINRIRIMEQNLTQKGMTTEEARIETRKKLYPSSLPKIKEDGTVNRSHNLLELRDTDTESEGNNLEEKANALFNDDPCDDDPFDNIEIGDDVDPDDICEETEIASFAKL